MYAKLINGRLTPAPKTVTWQGHTVTNPQPDKLLELGYLPVTYTDPPDNPPEGQHYESGWEQTETEILQVWTLADDPPEAEPEPTMSDLVAAIERGLTT